MGRLTDMPNIGATLAEKLLAAGIETPSALKRLGSVKALLRIRNASPDDEPCMSMLCALEGAIRGIRWHGIPRRERADLWQSYLDE